MCNGCPDTRCNACLDTPQHATPHLPTLVPLSSDRIWQHCHPDPSRSVPQNTHTSPHIVIPSTSERPACHKQGCTKDLNFYVGTNENAGNRKKGS